jgi:hypothetical protein
MKMIVEKQKECRLAGETEVLGENLPQRHFWPSQKFFWPCRDSNSDTSAVQPIASRYTDYAIPADSTEA